MKRKLVLFMLLSVTLLILTACGEESVDDVLKSLNEKTKEMSSFQADATMTITTGEEPQQFDVQIWHKKDDFYKVVLQNKLDEKSNQIILRNDEGVFVLTPSINKSYKFQNDWPNQHSQPYLYNSLVDDINNDSERQFKMTENYYVFDVKTNYKGNQQLPTQEIYFHKKTYQPALVKVKNAQGETMVEVSFTAFEFDANIEDQEFDTEYNLAANTFSVPSTTELEGRDITIYFPTKLPEGTEPLSEEVVTFDDGERVISTYGGEKGFTLVQEMYHSYPTAIDVPVYSSGDLVNLGFTMGHLTNHSLEWQMDGMNFVLASDSLTVEEMITIAQSVQQSVMK